MSVVNHNLVLLMAYTYTRKQGRVENFLADKVVYTAVYVARELFQERTSEEKKKN